MAFLDSVKSKCTVCDGKRYNNQVLKYRYNKKNIFEVLELTINEAAQFFNDNHNDEIKIHDFALLQEVVGLGYLKN